MTTIILFNGWGADPEDPSSVPTRDGGVTHGLEHLLMRLGTETLDPTFEKYGDFCSVADRSWIEAWEDDATNGAAFRALDRTPGVTLHFHGNFWSYSNAFSVVSDDEAVITALCAAIRANKATLAYKEARDERKAQDDYWAVQERRRRKEIDNDRRRAYRSARR